VEVALKLRHGEVDDGFQFLHDGIVGGDFFVDEFELLQVDGGKTGLEI
jgi:hypothetical protein